MTTRGLLAGVSILATLAVIGGASAATGWVKLGSSSDRASAASVSLNRFYPILAAGQRPYRYYSITIISRPSQRVRIQYEVQCSKGEDEASETYGGRISGTPQGKNYTLRSPLRGADYCALFLDAHGRGFLKVTLYGQPS